MRYATHVLILILSLGWLAIGIIRAEEVSDDHPDFQKLELEDGSTLFECFVKRVDTDGLLLRHSKGMAKVSFFELDHETQEKYGFDPVAALAAYEQRIERERNLRKEQVLESARRQASKERQQAEEERYELAQEEWLPCEAQIISSTKTGCYVRARQIVFAPTQIRSTLGFVRPGPPKRELKRFGVGMIFLENIEPIPVAGSAWQGYINPVTVKMAPDPETGADTIPVHTAIPKKP